MSCLATLGTSVFENGVFGEWSMVAKFPIVYSLASESCVVKIVSKEKLCELFSKHVQLGKEFYRYLRKKKKKKGKREKKKSLLKKNHRGFSFDIFPNGIYYI